MPANWPTTGRTPGSAMEYVRQLKALTAFSSLFEFNANSIKVDNLVFKLHSTVTVLILLVGTMFVSMRQYFGEPIECMSAGRSDIAQATIQHYCWLEATFSVPGPKSEYPGVHHAYPGIKTQGPNDKKVYHKYYQWVYFVLIIQVSNLFLFLSSLSLSPPLSHSSASFLLLLSLALSFLLALSLSLSTFLYSFFIIKPYSLNHVTAMVLHHHHLVIPLHYGD